MRYEISGGTFPVVTCGLANGEQMITEGGSMVWMDNARILAHFRIPALT